MATYNPFGAYLESKVLSASPLELVSLAYEGAIEAVGNARVCVREKRIRDRSRAITKAQLIIGELQRSLDFERGGDLSPQLSRLYDYMQRRLIDANFRQTEEPLAEVETLLETVLESWRELGKLGKPMVAAAGSTSSSSSAWVTPGDSPSYSFTEFTL
jgi:flagellar protein FliS